MPKLRYIACPECYLEALALCSDDGSKVIWCALGHVIVIDVTALPKKQVVYDFSKGHEGEKKEVECIG